MHDDPPHPGRSRVETLAAEEHEEHGEGGEGGDDGQPEHGDNVTRSARSCYNDIMTATTQPTLYLVTYVREPWSKPWEMEDYGDQERIDCGEHTFDGLVEGLLPGRYELRLAAHPNDMPITIIVGQEPEAGAR
jgi:hypothetical protein